MTQDTVLTFPGFFNKTLDKHPGRVALSMVGGGSYTYAETSSLIKAVMALLEKAGVRPGDRVAILGTNQPNWAVSYFAITFMGAVAVPLLPEFQPSEISSLTEHSGCRVIFLSEGLVPKFGEVVAERNLFSIMMEDFTVPGSTNSGIAFVEGENPVGEYSVNEDTLASIIYTSGTTGTPKGVMLTHGNICFSATSGFEIQHIVETDRFLSILPMSHTYENTLGLILPVFRGASVHYLGKAPTPNVLLPALETVRPTTILTVPLIIEKIFKAKVLPALTGNPLLKTAYKVPVLRKALHRAAGKKLMKTFGGELRFFGVGGAKLDKTVERFLIESGFPYAVGYGLTESAPLLAGFNPQNPVLQSTGPACKGVQVKIDNPDPVSGEGEIWAKGPNVMKGYYREPELTARVITADGWLRTGDLGTFDKSGNLFIRGRLKNMIVRSNGENVYPEDIETVINNFRHVVESLVVEKKGRLVALVHFNREEIEQRYLHLKDEVANYVDQKIEELRKELQSYVNERVGKHAQLQMVIHEPQPFSKTATLKIKRFLYT